MGKISIVIPNYNKGSVLEKTLQSIFANPLSDLEVIVVDDASTDDSVDRVKKYPCRLVVLPEHSGASKARNTGASISTGDFLFFIDSDCLLMEKTLLHVRRAIERWGKDKVIIGGTYSRVPYDEGFFSLFQSVFVNYSELKRKEPDYIATHAMIIRRSDFLSNGGFREDFLPILEDIEFSHRLKGRGYRLVIDQGILVQHVFNFDLLRSMKNAFRKSYYWTIYSAKKGDILADSGTASLELKINGLIFSINLLSLIAFSYYDKPLFLALFFLFLFINLSISRGLILAFYQAGGITFAFKAVLYYLSLYPLSVISGSLFGLIKSMISGKELCIQN